MPATAVSDHSQTRSDESPLRRVGPWIPLVLGASAIVIGGVLYSPQPVLEPRIPTPQGMSQGVVYP